MATSGFAPNDWREGRRLQALRLKRRGWHQRDIAEARDVPEGTVSRWLARACQGGPEVLLAQRSPGHPEAVAAPASWDP